MSDDLTPQEHRRLHWMMLRLRLPSEGVTQLFPSEDACRERLTLTRWPNGPECPKCGSKSAGYLEARRIYHCRNCHHQFTATSATILHRSHVKLSIWFAAAEWMIESHAYGSAAELLTGHALKDRLELSYAATVRLKTILRNDLEKEGGGLVGSCICTGKVFLPPEVEGMDRFRWVYRQLPEDKR